MANLKELVQETHGMLKHMNALTDMLLQAHIPTICGRVKHLKEGMEIVSDYVCDGRPKDALRVMDKNHQILKAVEEDVAKAHIYVTGIRDFLKLLEAKLST